MSDILTRIRTSISTWRARRSTIAALSALNDHQLRDIGIHRGEIASVAAEHAGRTQPTRVQTIAASRPAARPVAANQNCAIERDWREAA